MSINYNVNEQALGFDRVLVYEGQVEPLKWEGDKLYLQIKAPNANSVSYMIEDVERPCEKQPDGTWKVEYPLRVGMSYVQLKIDGVDLINPLLPISYGYSRPYNYVALETDEDFYRVKDVPHGSVRKEYFYSKVTGEWESCTVYTPYCYEKETDREFPVLYLQHGHGENEVGWTASGKVHFILDNLIEEKKAVPFIVVMSNGMVQTTDNDGKRIVDFHLLEDQLINDIIPFVEDKFRVKKDREHRAMAGLSMGSLQTSMFGLKHPELFSALGIFSGFVTDMITGSPLDLAHSKAGDNEHLKALDDAKKIKENYSVIFRAMGDKDPFWEFFKKDDEMLKEKGIEHTRKVYEGTHDWNVWRMCIRDFSQMIFNT